MALPIHKRWWGKFTGWLQKVTSITKDASVYRNFHWSDTVRISTTLTNVDKDPDVFVSTVEHLPLREIVSRLGSL